MKFAAIQALRAVAAWMVVLHHVHQIFHGFRVESLGGWLLATKGSVGVDLFFVISGFVMALSTARPGLAAADFLKRRFARIAPAYWVATLVFAALLLAFPSMIKEPFRLDALHLLWSLSFLVSLFPENDIPVLTVGWSLNFEMLFYLLLAISLWMAAQFRRAHLERWLLPALVLGLVYAYPWRLPGSSMFKSQLLLLFLAGYLLGLAHLARRRPPQARVAGLLLIGAGVACILLTDRNAFVLRALACTAVVWGMLNFEDQFARARLLVRLGDWSYSTYLVHLIVLMFVHQMSASSAAAGALQTAWIVAALLAILGLSAWSYRYIELPSQRLLVPSGKNPGVA